MTTPSLEILLSLASFAFTSYFWLVQARRERPQLRFYQIGDFRAMTRRHHDRDDCRRLSVQQLDSFGTLVANNSTRQNSIVLFECWFITPAGQRIRGDWGCVGEDRPPWNLAPESSISLSLACFFDVPHEFEIPEHYAIDIDFITASGTRFSHRFPNQAVPLSAEHESSASASTCRDMVKPPQRSAA